MADPGNIDLEDDMNFLDFMAEEEMALDDSEDEMGTDEDGEQSDGEGDESDEWEVDDGEQSDGEGVHESGVGGLDVGESSEGAPLIPKAGLRFEFLSDLMEFYGCFARSKGFQTRIKSVEYKTKQVPIPDEDPRIRWNHHANRCRLECSKAGKFKSRAKNPKNKTATIKTNCKARLNAWKEPKDSMRRITKVNLRHNHRLRPRDARFMRQYREISTRDKGRLVTNNRAGISMNKNYLSLVLGKTGFNNTTFTEKDARNLINKERRLQLTRGDVAAMRAWFNEQVRRCKDFVYVLDANDNGVLRNVFWVDGRSRAPFKDFGDVISFDTTYLKNRYKIPFAPFIGVNHHGQSTLVGCALLSGEDTENFVWLFEQWKMAMGGKEPIGIITDQSAAMGKTPTLTCYLE